MMSPISPANASGSRRLVLIAVACLMRSSISSDNCFFSASHHFLTAACTRSFTS